MKPSFPISLFLSRAFSAAMLVFGVVLFFSSTALAAGGDLDPSFGSGGKVVTSMSGGTDTFLAVAVQPDGKIVAVGYGAGVATDTTLVRYNTNGTLDTTFNGTGKVVSDFGVNNDAATAVVIQPDGKIVIAGNAATGTDDFLVARYNSNGTLDTTFNGAGYAITILGTESYATGVALQSDGKIVAVGNIYANNTFQFGVMRFNTNGTLDTTFHGTGIASIPVGGNADQPNAVAIQSDGKIVVAGSSSTGGYNIFGLVRLTAAGELDPTFNGTGKVVTAVGFNESSIFSIDIQPNGKIVAGGRAYTYNAAEGYRNNFAVVRYNADGTVDTSFNQTGGIMTPVGTYDGFCTGVKVLPNGKILAGGYAQVYTTVLSIDLAFARYNNDGTLDRSFGQSGTKTVSISPNDDSGQAMALQANGQAVMVGGTGTSASTTDSFVARFMNSTSAFDFDGDGKTDESVFRPTDNVWYLNRSQAGFVGYQFGAAGDLLAPADFTGDGKTDVAVFRPSAGAWFILRSEDSTFYSANFGANGDIPAPGDFDGDGKADTAVFRPSTGYWFIQQSTAGFSAVPFGSNGDVPTLGDYDGDGKTDVAVFRPSTGVWYRLNSSNGSFFGAQFGQTGDKVVPGDYSGDGKTDLAIYRPSNGTWYIQRSEDNSFYGQQFGAAGDLPAPGDFDGDGKTDVAVFRPGNGVWFEQRSTSGFAAVQFGAAGDKPAPNAFVY